MMMPPHEHSYWLQQSQHLSFPSLDDELTVDVAIAGGGIAGLTIAYLLKQSGLKVAVLEKNTIASGTTGGTTGKVTAQHELFYAELLRTFEKKRAQTYADAYNNAMDDIANLIAKNKLDCGWTTQDNFVYTTDAKKVDIFKKEAIVAGELGLPASFETDLPLPFPVVGAVKFARQAYFNAAAYTQQLAGLVQGNGSFVFEHSEVKDVSEKTLCTVTTAHGRVTTRDVVIATKIPPSPLAARFTYASVEYPHTSYIVAGKPNTALEGMYISPDKDHYSILPITAGKEKLLLIGGENHIPGLGNADKRYEKLASYAKKYFGVQTIDYRWKAMDYIAYDKLPVIGPLYPWSKHVYVVTGFKKWGLSSSMVAAKVIQQYIDNQKTPEMDLFYPHRFSAPVSMPKRMIQEIQKLF